MSTAYEEVVTWQDTATGSVWNSESRCDKGAIEVVQALFSDEFVLRGKVSATSSCGIQDVTDMMRSFCAKQVSAASTACEVSTIAFEEAAASSLCTGATNPSFMLRFNCDPSEYDFIGFASIALHGARYLCKDLRNNGKCPLDLCLQNRPLDCPHAALCVLNKAVEAPQVP